MLNRLAQVLQVPDTRCSSRTKVLKYHPGVTPIVFAAFFSIAWLCSAVLFSQHSGFAPSDMQSWSRSKGSRKAWFDYRIVQFNAWSVAQQKVEPCIIDLEVSGAFNQLSESDSGRPERLMQDLPVLCFCIIEGLWDGF